MALTFRRKGKDILATLTPLDAGEAPLTAEGLRDHLEAETFWDYHVFDDQIEAIFHEQRRLKEPITIKIAERRDFTAQVTVSPDKLSASITVAEAFGGKEPELEDLIGILREHKIYHGVLPEALEQILQRRQAENLVIARGDPPIDGQDAKFKPLILEPTQQGQPKIMEGGQVDFHDLQLMTTVEEGKPLMKKIPPTEGKPGMNVHKQEIMQKKGKDRPFGAGKGSRVSPYDPNLLLATHPGQVKVRSNFVSVETVFRVEKIGYETGDIFFPGTVVVDSDVSSRFRITATGDIQVSGTVEAAQLYAGGDIFLHSGVIGNKQAKIVADGGIQAKFAESSQLSSLASVIVSDMLLNSDVSAAREVIVGAPGTKGQILGGVTRAQQTIRARIVGGPTQTQTQLEVGVDPALYQHLEAVQQRLKAYKTRLDDMMRSMIHLKVNKVAQSLIDALEKLREVLLIKIHQLTEKESLILKSIQAAVHGRIIVTEQIHAGVSVRIGDFTRVFNTDFPGATLYVNTEQEEIAIGSLPKTYD